MLSVSILSLLIQAALIIHVIRTGRNTLWILAIGLLPGIGSLAYLVAEVLPELFRGRAARRAKTGIGRMIDPNRDLRRAAAEVQISGNVDARRRLGEELFERDQFDEAIEVYRAGLKGIFEYDPTLLLGLAKAQFARRILRRARYHAGTSRAAESGFQIGRRASSCMPGRSRPEMRSRRLSANTRALPRGILARRRACATGCCSRNAASCRTRSGF